MFCATLRNLALFFVRLHMGLQHQLHRVYAKTAKPYVFTLKNGCGRIRRDSQTVASLFHFTLKVGFARVRKNIEYCGITANGCNTSCIGGSQKQCNLPSLPSKTGSQGFANGCVTFSFYPQSWVRKGSPKY